MDRAPVGWAGRPLQILSDGPAFGGRARRVVGDHARRTPVPGQHDFALLF